MRRWFAKHLGHDGKRPLSVLAGWIWLLGGALTAAAVLWALNRYDSVGEFGAVPSLRANSVGGSTGCPRAVALSEARAARAEQGQIRLATAPGTSDRGVGWFPCSTVSEVVRVELPGD